MFTMEGLLIVAMPSAPLVHFQEFIGGLLWTKGGERTVGLLSLTAKALRIKG